MVSLLKGEIDEAGPARERVPAADEQRPPVGREGEDLPG